MKPKYASRVIETLHNAACKEILKDRMLDDFMNGSTDIFV
jgi:hypothetical protein